MGGKNVVATDIQVGDVVDYRGQHATVTKVWSRQEDSPLSTFLSPVGIELEWDDEAVAIVNDVEVRTPHVNRVRLTWPNLTIEQRRGKLLHRRVVTKPNIITVVEADGSEVDVPDGEPSETLEAFHRPWTDDEIAEMLASDLKKRPVKRYKAAT